ncbi:hypothetical protein [Rugamonas sp. DEMB1]|uniref:hypothetical protein n=1 Tax=Rugamonas sp. DEMB1 TaxID=3039386 RepID=UPI00244C2F23|nr:hypothetical protein [Rugamonas sp. DEMB1]WGG50682.1 hypothetical protein QC826_30615 [Rugamonas sp. DEMB1]
MAPPIFKAVARALDLQVGLGRAERGQPLRQRLLGDAGAGAGRLRGKALLLLRRIALLRGGLLRAAVGQAGQAAQSGQHVQTRRAPLLEHLLLLLGRRLAADLLAVQLAQAGQHVLFLRRQAGRQALVRQQQQQRHDDHSLHADTPKDSWLESYCKLINDF